MGYTDFRKLIRRLITIIQDEYSKLRRKRFWNSLFLLLGISFIIAISFSNNDAIREMATGAFSGGIIGLIILWYEQIREDEREEKQDQRDAAFAYQLQLQNKNLATFQEMSNIFLAFIQPNFDSLTHTSTPVKMHESSQARDLFEGIDKLRLVSARLFDPHIEHLLIDFNQESKAFIESHYREYFYGWDNSISKKSIEELGWSVKKNYYAVRKYIFIEQG